uniref:Pyrin domain-containing protein n=1 Tax=Cyprinus carpio carpio TaxID=630221 RepID=A0A8C1H0F4_CYPCA
MAYVSEQHLAALDDLDTDKLKRFKWRLKNHYCLSSAALEKADAPDTVDLMMKRFGPEEAVKISVEILRKMNQNHVAEQLEDKHKQTGNRLMSQVGADPRCCESRPFPTSTSRRSQDHPKDQTHKINLLGRYKVTPKSLRAQVRNNGKDVAR